MRAPEFWPRWRAELKRIKPDLLLLAESSARDGYSLANGFDAAYDWTDALGRWAWEDVFAEPERAAARLRAAIDAAPAPDRVFRFLNNNDTGARFVERHGPAMARLASTMLLTLPGLPLIYAGDEVGAAYQPYAGPPPLDWSDPHGLQGHYARLTALRRRHPALRSGALRWLDASRPGAVLAYAREAPGVPTVAVIVNFGADEAEVALPAAAAGAATDALTGAPAGLDGARVRVAPHTARLLLLAPAAPPSG